MADKQRIHVINNTSFYAKGMSGSDRRALEWSRCWIERGYDVHVFGHYGIKRRYLDNKVVVKYHTISDYRSKNNLKNIIYNTISAILNLKIKKASIIYSTSDLIADSIPGFISKLMNRKARWLCGMHLIAPNPFIGFKNAYRCKKGNPSLRSIFYFVLQKFVIQLYKRFSDLVLVSNNKDKLFLVERGLKKDRILVTYGGIDTKKISKETPKKVYDACFVGRFHAQKGLDDLLFVWSMICRKMKNAKLVIVGEGDMLEGLIKKSKELGIENNVIFTGFLDGKEKYNIMKSSRIFVFPSTYESFGMSALEAMACGLPVLAYNLPIYNEIFPEGMIKVPVGDKERFYKELIKLLKDKEKRDRLGKQAKVVASSFRWEKTIGDIMERLF